jgi:hypothetical protein
MRRVSLPISCPLAVVALLALAARAPAEEPLVGAKVYDSFNGGLLDPFKWAPATNPCFGNNLECVRDIEHGHLRLAVRNTGRRDSNSGIEWSASNLQFPSSVAAGLTSISAKITVRQYDGIGCPANIDDRTHTQVMIGGNYFNSGTGDPGDDVTGLLIVWIDTTDPTTMNVGNWWGWGEAHGYLGYWNPVASYPLGTPLEVNFTWDRPNHQFVASVRVEGDPGPGTQVAASYGDYGVSDELLAADPSKRLSAETHTLNCTDTLTVNHVDALFDRVVVN